MALQIDPQAWAAIAQQAWAAIAQRRARGRDATIALRLVSLRGWQHTLWVGWASGRPPCGRMVAQQVGELMVYLPARVARYAQWRDLTISASHLGPWEWLVVVDEPAVLLDLVAWEGAHPGVAGTG